MAAPAATRRTRRSSCMPRRSRRPARCDKLEGFASLHGADFYGLPRNTGTVTLRRESWTVPESVPFGEARLMPLARGRNLALAAGGLRSLRWNANPASRC